MGRFTCVMLLCVLSGGGPAAGASSGAGLADPVIIPGSRLELFQGKAIALLRVFAVRGDGLRAIPFQIDQRDSRDNWVWDVGSQRNQTNRYEYDNIGLVGPDWKRQRAGLTTDDQDPEGQALLDDGLSEVELMGGPIQSYAGIPGGRRRGEHRGEASSARAAPRAARAGSQ